MTDENAVRRAQQGDAVAFERIYRMHSRKVYTLCLRMVGDRTRRGRSDPGSLSAVVPEDKHISR